MGMVEEAQQQQQQQQPQPQQQPQQQNPEEQAKQQEGQKQRQGKRRVHDDPVVKAQMQAAEDESSEDTRARQSLIELDEGDSLESWESAATQEEQREYEAAMEAMSQVIYASEKSFNGLMKMVSSDDPVSGLVKAAATVVTEVDKKVDIPEVVIPQLGPQAFDMIHEMAVQSGVMQELDDQQVKSGVAAVQEMINGIYGGDMDDFNQLTQQLTPENVNQLEGVYNEVTGNGVSKGRS